MPRRPASITQSDISRAIRAARQTGAAGVEIEGGKIRILLDSPQISADQPVEQRREIVL